MSWTGILEALAARDPARLAELLEGLAERLRLAAGNSPQAPGGAADRVTIDVIRGGEKSDESD